MTLKNHKYSIFATVAFVAIILIVFYPREVIDTPIDEEGDLFYAPPRAKEPGDILVVLDIYELLDGQSQELAFGEGYVWHADSGQTARNVISKISAGEELETYNNPEAIKHLGGLAYSSNNIWGVDCQLPYGTDYEGTIYKIDTKELISGESWEKAIVSSFSASYPYTNQNAGLTCEDDTCQFIWLANWGQPAGIYRIDTEKAIADGFISQDSVTRTILPIGTHTNFQGLAWANDYLWVVDSTPLKQAILKIDPHSGSIVTEYALGTFVSEENCPENTCEGEGLAYDGEHLWFSTTRPQKLYKLAV